MTSQKVQDFSFSNLVDKNKIKYTRNKPLLILDLDEVVVHAVTSKYPIIEAYKKPEWVSFEKASLTNNFQDTYYHFFIRNGFHEFYNKIKKHYQVGIWSSSAPDYVYNIIENIFDNPEELSFIWSRDKTVKVPLNKYNPTSDYKFKYITCEAPTKRALNFYIKKIRFKFIGKKIRFRKNLYVLIKRLNEI